MALAPVARDVPPSALVAVRRGNNGFRARCDKVEKGSEVQGLLRELSDDLDAAELLSGSPASLVCPLDLGRAGNPHPTAGLGNQ